MSDLDAWIAINTSPIEVGADKLDAHPTMEQLVAKNAELARGVVKAAPGELSDAYLVGHGPVRVLTAEELARPENRADVADLTSSDGVRRAIAGEVCELCGNAFGEDRAAFIRDGMALCVSCDNMFRGE